MNFAKLSLWRHALVHKRHGVVTGVVLGIIAMGCSDSDGPPRSDNGISVVQSSSMLSKDAKTARAAGWTTETVHFDFVENGELKGGIVEIPSASPSLEAAFLAAAPLWNVVTLRDNGAPGNRIDIVIVGDGYTNAEMSTYVAHAENVVTSFFAEEPLSEYAELFNVHRVDVVSNESGVDNDPSQGISRDTALDMQYWCSGTERLLCVNTSKAIAAAAEAPDADQILAIANSSKYGGAGYSSSDLGTLAGGSGSAVEIALHEFGHSFADLADEYDYGGSETWTGGEPSTINISIYTATEMAAQSLKWFRWLDASEVDTFEGANYSMYGIYRPTDNSKMRALSRPFEQVNVEQLIIMIYDTVDPIDDASPAGTYNENDTLTVTPVVLSQHALDVQWQVDGVDIAGATQNTLQLASLGLSAGTYTVSVEVVDNTNLVRNESERAAVMTSTRDWTVEIEDTYTCDDTTQNGDETDLNCGGSCPKCPNGDHCLINADCESDYCDGGTCTPQNGNGVLIPARIEAEDYVRYYDTTRGNTGGGCDTGDDVDKENTTDNNGSCNVGWIAAGEWLEYDVTVAVEQAFEITARLAASSSRRTCRIEIDGVDVTGALQAPANGWQRFEDRTVSGVTIGAGDHVVRVYMITGLLNVNYIDFVRSVTDVCDDGICGPSEDCSSCPEDCGVCPDVCDDGTCDPTEDCLSCPEDCGVCPDVCDDGICGPSEDCHSCSEDCGDCLDVCDDGICGVTEDCSSCPEDCGVCPDICDDGTCGPTEDCRSCPEDCGDCPIDECTCPSGCDAVVNKTVDFIKDGPDNTCYFLSGSAGNFINSWNNNEVNLNGTDITNIWIAKGNYPAMVDGGYYLYINGSYPWSHVEVKN